MRFIQGNLFDASVEAVVNAVNTMGVMGKGIALMFEERFPENFNAYEAACKPGVSRSAECSRPPESNSMGVAGLSISHEEALATADET